MANMYIENKQLDKRTNRLQQKQQQLAQKTMNSYFWACKTGLFCHFYQRFFLSLLTLFLLPIFNFVVNIIIDDDFLFHFDLTTAHNIDNIHLQYGAVDVLSSSHCCSWLKQWRRQRQNHLRGTKWFRSLILLFFNAVFLLCKRGGRYRHTQSHSHFCCVRWIFALVHRLIYSSSTKNAF